MKKKWYQNEASIVLFLILFSPIGVILMWKYASWRKSILVIISAIVASFWAIAVFAEEPQNANSSDRNDMAIVTPSPPITSIPTIAQVKNTPTPAAVSTEITLPIATPMPTPTVTTVPTLDYVHELWIALDNSLETREGYDIEYSSWVNSAILVHNVESYWDADSLVRTAITDFVSLGIEAFKINGISRLDVEVKADFIDSYGNTSRKRAVRFYIEKEEFEKFQWDNLKYTPVFKRIQASSIDTYLHPALESEVNYDKLYYFSN